ncbi:MAG: hypothetical protein ACP5N9_06595 [Candidatus Bilamarchaeum sp.]|jgi:hypothetical protein
MVVRRNTETSARDGTTKPPRPFGLPLGGGRMMVPKSEVFDYLRSIGGSFPKALEAKIQLPDQVYRKEGEDGAEVVFRATATQLNPGDLHATIRGEIRITQSVVAVTEYQNNVFFVYVDPSRGINFSRRIGGLMSDNIDWEGVERGSAW